MIFPPRPVIAHIAVSEILNYREEDLTNMYMDLALFGRTAAKVVLPPPPLNVKLLAAGGTIRLFRKRRWWDFL